MKVSFFPPDMFENDREFLLDTIYRVGTSESFILGKNVAALEERFRKETGAGEAIAVHSGTGAVSVSLRAAGIGPGDEVIVQAFCCQPVAEEVINVGARPAFVDIDSRTMVMDPSLIEARVTPRTKAIMPAHLFSALVDMSAVNAVARKHRLTVIEDACVQQGAVRDGLPAGLMGDVGTYSFFQMKVMGGCGEGGMIVTNDKSLASACRAIRNHGQEGKTRFLHERLGTNSRMDEVMAAFLLRRFDALPRMLRRRTEIAKYYGARFVSLAERVVLPDSVGEERCHYMYCIQTSERDALRAHLAGRGIASHVYYPIPLPMQGAFLVYADPTYSIENSKRASNENLALPIYPHLTDAQAEAVADAVVSFFA